MTKNTSSEKELLLNQAAAILAFLQANKFEKAAKKLAKEIEKSHGALPSEPNGQWKWIPTVEYDSDSSEEEESESASEYETDSDEEGEEEEKGDTNSDEEKDEKAASEPEGSPKAVASKGFGRQVSFSDDADEVRLLSPKKASEKKKLYYNKADMQRFDIENKARKSQEAEESLQAMIAATSATMGFSYSM